MSKVKVKVVNTSKNPLPKYAHNDDAGLDLRADLQNLNDSFWHGAAYDSVSKCVRVFSGGQCLIPTGLHMSIPSGYYLAIVPRSGLALKQNVSITNSPGTIDANYRGDIGIIIQNLGEEDIEIYQGDKIAQAILQKYSEIEFEEVESLDETTRGTNGFGSTGV